MEHEKILTISIAAYNVEAYIRETLESLLHDDIADDLEILVIDDGGTDHTLEIAAAYAEVYPESVICVHKENGGYGSTINTGIARAKGKYFKQLDGDDWYDAEGLRSLVRVLKQTDADLVLSSYYKVTEPKMTKEYCDIAEHLPAGQYSMEELTFPKCVSMYSVTYKSQLLREHNIRIAEHCFYTDCEYATYPNAFVKTVEVTHDPVYCYRLGRAGQSMSLEGLRRHIDDHRHVVGRLLEKRQEVGEGSNGYAGLLRRRMLGEALLHYDHLYMLEISRKNKKRILQYDSTLKKQDLPIYEELGRTVGMIRWLRKSGGRLYTILCLYVRIKKKMKARG
ncbi:MAG: glycosyltransferase family 2 protein [Lachnospiraceae bacterium]|nr:glycosyltransferase family 2 protein [Lachnospiraceae bacterium]